MGVLIKNPHNEAIKELVKDKNGKLTEEEEKQLVYLQNESRLFLTAKLEELEREQASLEKEKDEFRIRKSSLPLSKIYKKSTELYRENQRLTESLRAWKKEIREEIESQRAVNRKKQTTLQSGGF